MPNPSFRIDDELYAKMKATAAARNISMSDLVREAVRHYIELSENPSQEISQSSVELLQQQLAQKDTQIRELHQIVAMGQRNAETLMNELNSAKQLEDMRSEKAKTWWERLMGK